MRAEIPDLVQELGRVLQKVLSVCFTLTLQVAGSIFSCNELDSWKRISVHRVAPNVIVMIVRVDYVSDGLSRDLSKCLENLAGNRVAAVGIHHDDVPFVHDEHIVRIHHQAGLVLPDYRVEVSSKRLNLKPGRRVPLAQ